MSLSLSNTDNKPSMGSLYDRNICIYIYLVFMYKDFVNKLNIPRF